MERRMRGKGINSNEEFGVLISHEKEGYEIHKSIDYPIHISITIWLVFSSCFFLIPGAYAFFSSYFFFGCVSTITTVNSINHWRKAEDGMRRTIDRITASISFAIYFCTGCIFLRGPVLYAYAIPGVFAILGFYYLSHKFANQGSNKWLYSHFFFHLFVGIEQFVVLYGISESNVTGL